MKQNYSVIFITSEGGLPQIWTTYCFGRIQALVEFRKAKGYAPGVLAVVLLPNGFPQGLNIQPPADRGSI